MDERARFCPGCWTPRTAVREQLEREAAATGVPYEALLERELSAYRANLATQGSGWATPAGAAPAPVTSRSRLWWVLGVIGGVFLLFCVGCVIVAAVAMDRFDVDIGDSDEGDVAREQLQLAANGRHEERWLLLHPDQQEHVSVDLFVTCAQHEGVDSIDIFGSFANDDSFIPRVGIVDSRVVIYSLSGGMTTDSNYVEMVRTDGEWRWTLNEPELDALEAGRCP
jgi:hypothetical protein